MGDLTRLTGNLAEPLTFNEYGEAGKFVRERVCAFCFAHLVVDFASNRKYTVKCPNCGPVYAHTHVHVSAAERAADSQLSGEYELRRK